MKRTKLAILSTCVFLLCGCGQADVDTQGSQGSDTQESVAVTTEAPAETLTPASEETTEASVETEEPTSEPAVAVWTPAPAPAVRNTLTEEEKSANQQVILDKGTFLYSGKTNAGYYASDIAWLQEAEQEGSLALIFACDDLNHGGWGVLGMDCNVAGQYKKLMDVNAFADQPDKERLVLYSIRELTELAGVDSAAEFESFSIGAWNGGRIAGLYYLSQEVTEELNQYLAELEETEQIIHTYTGALSNENAIESAQVVYDYLKQTYGTACITGQMESTWMGSPDYELDYIEEQTGKLPAIRGLDFMHDDFEGVVTRATQWWEDGGIPTICWHTGADFSSAYDESLADDINWDEAFVPGSDTYNSLLEGMDRAVPYLQQLEDAGVPILWRPFHELDGGWFWWSKGGSENFVKLWQMMYSRYTDYWGLDNLIWVYGYSSNGADMAAWYPGDDYVDLLGADSYDAGPNEDLYIQCDEVAPEGMPLVFHECGNIPTEEELTSTDTDWLFFMTWHTDHITNEEFNKVSTLNEIYNSEYFITLDELPAFK